MTNLPDTRSAARGDPLRILAVSNTWDGANDYSFVRAFRRAGHSVTVVSDEGYVPAGWRHPVLRAARRLALPVLVAEYQRALLQAAERLRPDLFFVFKGTHVAADTVRRVRALGAYAVNFYPDVSFIDHGRLIGQALPEFDHVFTTKSFHLGNRSSRAGIPHLNFLPHGYDPEVHCERRLDARDVAKYACELSFIGTRTPKKEQLLQALRREMPSLDLKIWGNGWTTTGQLAGATMGQPVNGAEYAKAVQASRISLAVLSEAKSDPSIQDQTTARTFEIPAIGGFMLHERTAEAQTFFTDGSECAMYSDVPELVRHVAHYLAHPEERDAVARAGHARCLQSHYAIDDRANTIIAHYRSARGCTDRGREVELSIRKAG